MNHKVISCFLFLRAKTFKVIAILTQKAITYMSIIFLRKGFFFIKMMVENILKIHFTMLSNGIFILGICSND